MQIQAIKYMVEENLRVLCGKNIYAMKIDLQRILVASDEIPANKEQVESWFKTNVGPLNTRDKTLDPKTGDCCRKSY
ncbi:hypothetical protein Fmac_025625 [Flemingia macrophylla]|uniref:Uncharacterized protein n=1 Tax=Flemingia macrophylla TaxID=520843 RepID=A0ABD1LST1_9FABA